MPSFLQSGSMSGYSTHSVLYGIPLKFRVYLGRGGCGSVRILEDSSSYLVLKVLGDHALPGTVDGIS
jgi:hypothetical protein